jgi:benzoylformate decarboxylase
VRMCGAKALMEVFCQEGVEYIFGIPGATEVYFMNALEDYPAIQYMLGLHEAVATGMAEGYSRTSGKPAVLNLHTITGLGAATPLLSNALSGGVPLIVTAGQQDTRLKASEPALAGDLVKLASQFTKWSTEITHATDIPMVFRRAFKVALHPPSGPVFVSLPQDILESEIDFSYTKNSPYYFKLRPDPEAIKLAAGLISKSQNPAMIVEDGVAKSQALSEVVKLAELIGARVYQPWMSDVNFPVNHSQYFGDLNEGSLATPETLVKADAIISIGTGLFSQTRFLDQPLLPSNVPLIQIDDNPWEIGKNFAVAAAVEGDIKLAVDDLTRVLKQTIKPEYKHAVETRMAKIEVEKKLAETAFSKKSLREKNNIPISATRIMKEINDTLPTGARIVDDCWSASAILRRVLKFDKPLSYQRSRNGGSIGWGLPGSLGVKIASPYNPVICISGDGSAMWSIQSLWTAARYQIPVTFIILSNGCYQQVRNMRKMMLGEKALSRVMGTNICNPRNDFCKIAEGMNISAHKVEKPADLKKALKRAFGLNKPNLLEVEVDTSSN